MGLNLSLSYSSEGINSVLASHQDRYIDGLSEYQRQASIVGWGWNLGGLGQITHDHGDDTYSISFGGGSFEILKPEQTGNGWQTSPQSFLKIDQALSPEGKVTYWRVKDTKGTEYTFGDDPVSNNPGIAFSNYGSSTSCDGQVHEAHLTRVQDPLGNAVRILYIIDVKEQHHCPYQKAVYPQRIEYWPVGATQPSAQVLFTYGPRTDTHVQDYDNWYVPTFYSDERLQTVTMQVRDTNDVMTTARRYDLGVHFEPFNPEAPQPGESLMILDSLQEYGRDGTSLPAWTFGYQRLEAANPLTGIDWAGNTVSPSPKANLTVLTEGRNGQGGAVRYGYGFLRDIPYNDAPDAGCSNNRRAARFRVISMESMDGLGNTTYTSYDARGATVWSNSGPESCAGNFEFGGYEVVTQTVRTGNAVGTIQQKAETTYHTETEVEWGMASPWSYADVKGKARKQRLLSSTNVELAMTESGWKIQEDAATRNSPWVYQEWERKTSERQLSQITWFGYQVPVGQKLYGNLTLIAEYQANGTRLYRERVREYYPNEDAHIVGLVAREVLYDRQGSIPVCKGETVYLYDGQLAPALPQRGQLTRQSVSQTSCGGSWSSTSFMYDTWGNLTQVTDPRGSITKTTYDTVQRVYPVSTTLPPLQGGNLVLTTRHSWDLVLGQVTSTTTPHGLVTRYSYDGLGRLVAMWRDGYETLQYPAQRLAYTNAVGSTPMSVKVSQRMGDGTTPPYQDAYTFYDGFGREVQTRALSPASSSQHAVTLTRYDAAGRPSQVYAPVAVPASPVQFYGPADALWSGKPSTRTEYDQLGRPTKEIAPNGDYTEHRYGLVQDNASAPLLAYHDVMDANRHRMQYRTDPFGRMVEVVEITGSCGYWGYTCVGTEPKWVDPGTRTRYEYDAADLLISVTDTASNKTTITYDLLGRKTTMIDPDMGTWRYSYDAANNLLTQTDQRGCLITFGYDALSRLTRKSYTATGGCTALKPQSVTYAYDSHATDLPGVASAPGQRTQMSDGSGNTRWIYDRLGRPTREEKTVNGTGGGLFATEWGYDPAGRPQTIRYPADNTGALGEAVTTTYHPTTGQITRLSGSDGSTTTSYASGMTYTLYGQLATLKFNEGTRTQTYSYNPLTTATGAGLLASSQLDLGARRLSYTYDKGGNVASIAYASTTPAESQTQEFRYDERDRLTSAWTTGSTNGQYSESYQYDSIGNLTRRSATLPQASALVYNYAAQPWQPLCQRSGQAARGARSGQCPLLLRCQREPDPAPHHHRVGRHRPPPGL
ncbi:MAG: RHS repeat protein [Ardenticatenales bacterium]|nr:RHS repeat protein [Ardenticatenales bacterium]